MKYTGSTAKYPFLSLSKEGKVGDRYTIEDAGEKSTSRKFTFNDGTPKPQYNFSVGVGTELKTLSFNDTSMKNMKAVWGEDTEAWVGHIVEVYLAKGKTGSMYLALLPVVEKLP